MDKVKVLMAICETPGWQPPEDSSSIDRSLEELQREGWIAPRLDGYEATPEALDAYPDFGVEQMAGTDRMLVIAAPKPPATNGNGAQPEHVDVPFDRVVRMIEAMLYDLPLAHVVAYATRTPAGGGTDATIRNIAREITEAMR